MTRYTVVYHRLAQNELAEIWLDHPDQRTAITGASNAIDRALAEDGASKGKSARGPIRKYVEPPLTVYFIVSEADRLLQILGVSLHSE
jgi:hypothetical protein